jgi:lysophospholipase L1-like esterase
MRALVIRILSTCLMALFAVTAMAQNNSAIVPAVKMDRNDPTKPNKGFLERHESFVQRVKQGNADLLLIGDSITHGWEKSGAAVWDKYYAPRNAVNLGIGGDRTQHVLWRFLNGEIDGISPKVAVIMIGTNNSRDNTSEEIAAGVTAIVQMLRKELPMTKILLLAIFPRGADVNDELRIKNEAANAIIGNLDDGQMIRFLNINNAFLNPDGVLPKDIMPDLLHPKEVGYGIWARTMEPTLSRMMGDTPVQ